MAEVMEENEFAGGSQVNLPGGVRLTEMGLPFDIDKLNEQIAELKQTAQAGFDIINLPTGFSNR